MAHNDGTSALELHIKVNGQNLSAISEKCDIGTLRLPSDPSWPKIPPRRLSDNTDDIIKPPYMITVTGTPRKSRSTVQTIPYKHAKPVCCQKYEVPTHIPRKLSSYNDPRFKRQISRDKAEKPDEACNMKNDKQMSESDTHNQQENKKFEDNLQKIDKNVNNCTSLLHHDVDKLSESVVKLMKKTTDCLTKEQSISETNRVAANQYVIDERCDIESRFCQQKQEANKPLLLMVDEKKIHALPINTLNIEATPAQPLQCYSVQIPVVTYCNVPLQIPNISTQIPENVKIPECQSDNVKRRETVENTCAVSNTLTNSTCNSKESRDKEYLSSNELFDNVYLIREMKITEMLSFLGIQQRNVMNSDDNKNISHCNERITDQENILNRNTVNEVSRNHTNFNTTNNMDDMKNDENSSNLNAAERLNIVGGKECNTNSCVDDCIERKRSSEKSLAHSRNQRIVKDERINTNESSMNVTDKTLQKNIQSLAFGEVKGKGERNNESKEKHEELCGSLKHKTASMNLSRKAKSFFRKKSRLAIVDSNCTLILPGPRRIRGKQYEKTCGRLKGRINSRSLTNLPADNSFDRLSSIPLETQELLNKNYWEYYRKLKRKLVLTKPDTAGEHANKLQNRSPESQTLQQCSLLSCMINTTLRDSTTVDKKSLSDPATNVASNVRENIFGLSSAKKRKRTKQTSKRPLELKTIALLGITMYVAIIFLPIMYDYFFDEEHDDYENMSYLELTLQYVTASFGEAFGGIVEVLNTVFLRPCSCGKCNDVI
ncbi:uncharacterized protein [Linepithema humile]|uniref:uncharacterized protein isoform X3 n=1 Tax=Linepithema humile TaxID=83485 RepID=UPI00351ECDA6